MTHFATADDDPAFAREQLGALPALGRGAARARTATCSLHAANSAATLRDARERASTWSAAASRSTAWTRSTRDPAAHGLEPALELASLPRRGQALRAGRERGLRAPVRRRARRRWIGTVPIGYGDGVRRGADERRRRARRRAAATRSPGRCRWTTSRVDLGPATRRRAASEVVLLGARAASACWPRSGRAGSGTINYEVTCGDQRARAAGAPPRRGAPP